MGFYNSLHITYPYYNSYDSELGTCEDYDPRFRPWYNSATTGAKNVILLIDKSSSMCNHLKPYRMDPAKSALKTITKILGSSDYF